MAFKKKLTKFPNGVNTVMYNAYATVRATSFTIVDNVAGATGALGDVGKAQLISSNALTATLPALATGGQGPFAFMIASPTGIAFNISPNSTDAVLFAGTSVDNTDVFINASEANFGDYIVIANTSLATDKPAAWVVTAAQGAWRKATA